MFALSGFGTLKRDGIKVSLGNTAELSVALKLSPLAEEVTVHGEAPVVDTQSTQVSTTCDKDWVRNAPIKRFSFFDLINAAPARIVRAVDLAHPSRAQEGQDLIRPEVNPGRKPHR